VDGRTRRDFGERRRVLNAGADCRPVLEQDSAAATRVEQGCGMEQASIRVNRSKRLCAKPSADEFAQHSGLLELLLRGVYRAQ
jgi:hypothetical protein